MKVTRKAEVAYQTVVSLLGDPNFKEIEMELEKAAGQVDHSESDCIFIAVLSHGELGILYASDHAYKPDRLWTAFNAEKCPTLAGNTNLFLKNFSNFL